jgi:hypothetical protein
MVMLFKNPNTIDFGSQVDLPGVKYPTSAAEAAFAKYCVTWPVNNRQATSDFVLLIPQPAYTFGLRQGAMEQAANVPFSTTAYLTYPGNQNGVTIPSGWQALAFDRGVFTVPSGSFIYSASLVNPGSPLEVVSTSGADQGKLQAKSAGTQVAVTERYDTTTGNLTFRTL